MLSLPQLVLLVSEGSVGNGGISSTDNKGTEERIDKSKYLVISAEQMQFDGIILMTISFRPVSEMKMELFIG